MKPWQHFVELLHHLIWSAGVGFACFGALALLSALLIWINGGN